MKLVRRLFGPAILSACLAIDGCSGNVSVDGTGGAGPATGGQSTGGVHTGETGGGTVTGGKASGGNVTGGNASGGSASGGSASGGKATGGTGSVTPTGGTGGTMPMGGKPSGGTGGGTGTGGSNSSSATATVPGMGCTAPSAYANLFVTLSNHTQAEVDAKIAAAWNKLFNPSDGNTVYYNGPGSDEAYVKDVANNDVRTEGQSYGMMIALQLDHQAEFDKLWQFTKKHMVQSNGQIAWHTSTSGGVLASGGAPDGDEYFAAALVFASKRWGDTSGKFNYATEAKAVLKMIRTQDFNDKAKLVQFYVGSGNTDGSYILPAFYQTWACFDTENAEFWNAAVTAGRAFFKAAVDSNFVIGDQSSFTGQTVKGAGSDTVRCVMNIMMDHNFFRADPWQEMYASKYSSYVNSHGQNNGAFTSCNSLLGYGLPAAMGKSFVDKLWSMAVPTGQYRYYDGTLYFLALLHVSGTFKLWY